MCSIAIVVIVLAGAMFKDVQGRVLSVPSVNFPSIQSAIDSAWEHDTVSIAEGRYAEALRISGRSLSLIGSVAPDSTAGNGVIIDPTPLDSSQFLACMTLVGGNEVHLEQLWIRNGPAMHVDRPYLSVGGIDNHEGPPLLTLKDCRFDSVVACIYGGKVVDLTRVRIVNCERFAVFRRDSTRVFARESFFHGVTDLYLVHAWTGSQFEDCSFMNDSGVDMLYLGKDSLLVSRCHFGPFEGNCRNGLFIRAGTGTRIIDNVFEDCQVGTAVLRVVQLSCTTAVAPEFEPPLISGNIFRNIANLGCQGGYALELHCDGGMPVHFATVEDNIFENSASSSFTATAVYAYEGGASFSRNAFRDLLPPTAPAVFQYRVFASESSVFRDNTFYELEIAIEHADPGQFTDARWNWWGDSSGPYNAGTNPEGLGAEVSDGVLFEPWLGFDPDSTDTNGTAIRPQMLPLPVSDRVSVSPNPFNSSVTILLEVEHAGIYDLRLFDLTGREVSRIFRGVIQSQTQVQYTNPELASGVYFVQLRRREGVVATTKILLLK
jgi:hypothetical protein